MNWLDFFASVIGSLTSLAWPAALVAAVWIFRGEIRPLLPRLRLKHKETEISFRLDAAEKVIEQLPSPPPDAPPVAPEELSRFEEIARLSPSAALIEIRRDAEFAIRERAAEAGLTGIARMPLRQVLRALRGKNLIGAEASALFDDILAIGNAAAHGQGEALTTEDALRYRFIADRAIFLLDIPPVPDDE